MKHRGGEFLIVLSMLLIAVPATAATRRFALVVGNNASDAADVAPLKYADDDALATHALFQEAGVEAVLLASLDDETAQALGITEPPPAPTSRALWDAFGMMEHQMRDAVAQGQAVEFIFYYSGHGNIADGEGYVVLADGRLTRHALWDRMLARSPAARNHVMVDACRSYFMAFGKGPGGQRAPAPAHFAQGARQEVLARTGLMLSTSSERDSHEWERYRAGVFSHELRSALRGGADLDQNGTITYAELGGFLRAANEGIVNARFRPDFLVVPPHGADQPSPQVFAWSAPPTLFLDARPTGHLYVEDPFGTRLADVHPGDMDLAQLHLPQTRPLFVRTALGDSEYVLRDAGSVALSGLEPAPRESTEKGAQNVAFLQLFSSPFVTGHVSSFSNATLVASPEPAPPARWLNVGAVGAGVASGALVLAAAAQVGMGATLVALDAAWGWRPGTGTHRITLWQAWLRDGATAGALACVAAALAVAVAGSALLGMGWFNARETP